MESSEVQLHITCFKHLIPYTSVITYDQNLIKNKQSKCEVHHLLCIKGGVGTFFVRKMKKEVKKWLKLL